jgi:hypothetical protein
MAWSNEEPSFPINTTSIHEVSYLDEIWSFADKNNVKHLDTK